MNSIVYEHENTSLNVKRVIGHFCFKCSKFVTYFITFGIVINLKDTWII